MRINLFTLGDSADINTWSNLPYYFHRHLVARSVDVRPFDLIPSRTSSYRTLSTVLAVRARVVRVLRPDYRYGLLRSRAYHVLVNRRLRAVAAAHTDVDLNLFLTFTFSSYRFASVPVVHFCDRTYEQHLEETGRTPGANDLEFIRIDRENIEHADLVLSTSDACSDFIKTRYRVKRSLALKPGINTEVEVENPEGLIARKEQSTDILFIGKDAQSRGADILIRSFRILNARHHGRLTLHVVGVLPAELPEELRDADASIRFHGYLDRSDANDLARYHDLLRTAKLFVMPMRPGPFPGVIREAQLYGTPVVASNLASTREILSPGRDCVLVDGLEPAAFADAMGGLFTDAARWRQLARNAHSMRQGETWMKTVNTFVDYVRDAGLLRTSTLASMGHACESRISQ